ncbi:hypothetical protein NMY3_03461 [Candidatus Nitrosocosmicus oleophilus]|uniref:Uncharacterized protein n=1 Tax=Candidatus Nitrosocosmicus oleophilus TaxID=1353260 RepID=A0A654M4H8_9ARCH|nr:hypothetical protein NMY3_03461 [Candidatus Nitrosocosmicus oleophilus]
MKILLLSYSNRYYNRVVGPDTRGIKFLAVRSFSYIDGNKFSREVFFISWLSRLYNSNAQLMTTESILIIKNSALNPTSYSNAIVKF